VPKTTIVPPAATTPQYVDENGGSDTEVTKSLGVVPTDDNSIATRRSRREVRTSSRMKDSLEYLGRTRANVASTTVDDLSVPKTFIDAMRRPELWFEPMVKEIQTVRDKGVYRLVPRPLHKNVVKCRWVYALKFDDVGSIASHKARLIAKGFTQVLREDYDETYASVARLESV
jgi:hypothetical protein